MHLEVFLLGRFEVRCNGVPVTGWPRAGVKRLFKLLALAPRQGLPASQLAAALWPNDWGDRVRQRLHHQLYLLRKALDVQAVGANFVLTDDGLVQLAAPRLSIDVSTFEAAADAALRQGGEAALRDALALYGGPLLPGDIDDAEFDRPRSALAQRQAALLRALAQCQAARGALDAAVDSLRQLLQQLPADEDAHRALIEAHAALGRRDDAERQYLACKAALQAELGVPPSAATHQAYRQAMLPTGREVIDRASPHGDTRATEPPARGLDDDRWRPPVPLVPLIGRDAIAEAVAARLREPHARLVTLVGGGGLGKTQLALRVAHELQAHYRHGACFVSLAEVDGDGVADRLRRALRLAEPLGEDTLERVAERLRDRHLLLVCDNCEHVADRLGLLTALLERAPGLTVLATSRRRLNLRAEQVVPVPPLAATGDEGVRLFAERAHAASPDFALDDRNARDVTTIVQQLRGVPLAIELVAARVALWPPAQLRQALAEGEALAAGGGPDRPPRHRSLRASLAWSHQLLTTDERAVLARAALFPAPFELGALASLCPELSVDVAQVVQTLGELGLLARAVVPEAGASSRWQLLAGTRSFVRGDRDDDTDDDTTPPRVAGSEHEGRRRALAPAVLQRFVAWHAELARRLADRLAGGDTAQALAAFEADHDNFFHALAMAESLSDAHALCQTVQGLAPYWGRTGAWQRAAPWVERAEAVADALPRPQQAPLLLALATYWHEACRYDRAHAAALRAAALAAELNDAVLRMQAVSRQASSAYYLGAAHSALADLEAARDAVAGAAHAAIRRAALNNLGNVYLAAGQLARAGDAWTRCDAEMPRGFHPSRVAYAHNLALVAHYEGRYDDASAWLDDAEQHELAGVPRPARQALIQLRRCWMACCQGEVAVATAALAQACDSATRARLPGWQLACVAHGGKLAWVSGQRERAVALLSRAAERRDELADPWDALDLLLWLVRAQAIAPRAAVVHDTTRRLLAQLMRDFGTSWRLEHARILEAAAAWLLQQRDAAAVQAAGRAWQQAQQLRRAQGLKRFAVEQAGARRAAAALRSRLGPGGLSACEAAVDAAAPLQWLQPWLA